MICTEVVHLDADNKVLIEVLDGRSIRLTFNAHPVEAIYKKKKIVAIEISGIPYVSLQEQINKVFVTINDRLHTYDITEIDQIGNNCFQVHTMVRTKSSFFATPMLGESRNYFKWSQYFVNTFITEDKNIVLLYRFFDSEDYKKFEHQLKKNDLFIKLVDYDNQHVAFKFKVPAKHEDNLEKFINGEYSKMSDDYKEEILLFHGIKGKDTMVEKVLFRKDDRRKQLEFDLGVSIPPDVELYDKPGEIEIFKKK